MSSEPAVDPATHVFLGSLVADAVAMPVHWYYDQAALDRDYPALAAAAASESPYLCLLYTSPSPRD